MIPCEPKWAACKEQTIWKQLLCVTSILSFMYYEQKQVIHNKIRLINAVFALVIKLTWFWRYLPCSWYMKAACRIRHNTVNGVNEINDATKPPFNTAHTNADKSTIWEIMEEAELTGSAGIKIFTYSWERLTHKTEKQTAVVNHLKKLFEHLSSNYTILMWKLVTLPPLHSA